LPVQSQASAASLITMIYKQCAVVLRGASLVNVVLSMTAIRRQCAAPLPAVSPPNVDL